MLGKKTLPVWMLADALVGVLVVGATSGLLSGGLLIFLTDSHEKTVRQELLNLQGDLSQAIFLIDISGSMDTAAASPMDRPNWGGDGRPWTYVQNQVDSWLANLPVSEFRVICFNHETREYPAKTIWGRGAVARQSAVEFLRHQEPRGPTFTERAFQRAFACQPTSILFFTDGAPTDENGALDLAQQERILRMMEQPLAQGVPINVVALNNYFDPQLAGFLHSIAARSGGSFIGL